MFQKLDSIIKRADAIRYFIMHAIGGTACLLLLQLPLVLLRSPLACAAWPAPALPLPTNLQPARGPTSKLCFHCKPLQACIWTWILSASSRLTPGWPTMMWFCRWGAWEQ